LDKSHREVIARSPVAIPCRASIGQGRHVVDSDGRRWCGDFVIGNKDGPYMSKVPGANN
jgi:hypothetical protein